MAKKQKPDFGVPVMLVVPGAEIDRILAAAKKRLGESRLDRAVTAHYIQSSMLEELENAALEWADAEEPDLSRVLAQLVLLRQFRKMLKALPAERNRRVRPRR